MSLACLDSSHDILLCYRLLMSCLWCGARSVAVLLGNSEPMCPAVAFRLQVPIKVCLSLFTLFASSLPLGYCPCVALIFIFLSISSFISMESLRCVMSDTLFFVSYSAASVNLVSMSFLVRAAMARCSIAPPDILHFIGQVESGVPSGDLGLLHQVMICLCKYCFEDGLHLFHHRLLAPLLQCKSV